MKTGTRHFPVSRPSGERLTAQRQPTAFRAPAVSLCGAVRRTGRMMMGSRTALCCNWRSARTSPLGQKCFHANGVVRAVSSGVVIPVHTPQFSHKNARPPKQAPVIAILCRLVKGTFWHKTESNEIRGCSATYVWHKTAPPGHRALPARPESRPQNLPWKG